jgi:hypothetical protein
LDGGRTVEADVFLLTDEQPELLAGGAGLTLARSEAASPALLADLRSDVGMEWVPQSMWLSYLQVEADAGELDYDLAVSADRSREPSVADAGVGPASLVPVVPPDARPALWPLAAGLGTAAVTLVGLTTVRRLRIVRRAVAP